MRTWVVSNKLLNSDVGFSEQFPWKRAKLSAKAAMGPRR